MEKLWSSDKSSFLYSSFNIFLCEGLIMNEQTIIIQKYTDIFIHSDARQWEKVEARFSDQVNLDYTSLSGQPAVILSGSEIVKAWSAFLPKFKFTMHYLTNHKVSIHGDPASATCYGHAIHQIPDAEGGDFWEVYGTYDFSLEKTDGMRKVNALRYNHRYAAGNLNLPVISAGS
jgi:hypothetical protein